MLRRLSNRLSYANVVASLALSVALGGTSYAAIKLPRNSVGSAQIRSSAVGGNEVRNGAIKSADISKGTRRALQGKAGPAGPAGTAGASAVKYFAAVSASGGLARGNATAGAHPSVGSGAYSISFAQSVSACVYSATIGTTDVSGAPAGRVTVRDAGGSVGVQTYDASGTAADLPFHLLVSC